MRIRILRFVVFSCLMAASSVSAEKGVLEWSFPLARPHCGVALGNGAFGVLVWGDDELRLTVSRNDVWDHRHGVVIPEGIDYQTLLKLNDPKHPDILKNAITAKIQPKPPFPSTLLPGGRFDLSLRAGLRPSRARLNVQKACLEIRFDSAAQAPGPVLELRLSPQADLLWVSDPGGVIERVTPRPTWEWTKEELAQRGFEAPELFAKPETAGWFQACPEDPGLFAKAVRVDNGWLVGLSLAESRAAGETLFAGLTGQCAVAGEPEFRRRHEEWWAEYWVKTPRISIPDDFFQKFYEYAQYKFACAANPHARRPAPLQGPWLEEHRLPTWGGDYTMNVNIQMIYTLGFASGNLHHLLPLFDMLDSREFQAVMRQNAAHLVHVDDGLLLTHSVNDQGRHCQTGLRQHAALDQAVTGWLAHMYWLYYRYSQDKVFLRERAWPFLTGAMRVYEAMLEEHEGRLSLPLAPSPEFGAFYDQAEAGRDSSWQLGCIHMLAEALLQAAEILDLPAKPLWREIPARLPRYSLVPMRPPAYRPAGDYGQSIGLWEGQDLPESYRHHSHLGAIYPFDSLGESTPEQKRILENTLTVWTEKSIGLWSEWCMPWAAIIQARTGFSESPRVLLNIWRELFVNEGLATVYIPRIPGISAHRRSEQLKSKAESEIMQLDGTMGCATALLEMLVHERRGVVHVFPAVSETWPDAEFSRVRLPGGFELAGKRQAGHTQAVEIFSPYGGLLKLANPWSASARIRRKGKKDEEMNGELLAIKTQPNDLIEVFPGGLQTSLRGKE